MQGVLKKFLDFVAFETTSDYYSETIPSTKEQLEFAKYLESICKKIGFTSVTLSDNGYLYCFLKGDGEKSVGFIAHMDTSPDSSGNNVKAKIIKNYDGGDIKLNDLMTLSRGRFKSLDMYIGDDIVTTDGTTLLGADDKAGIAEILTAVEYVIENKVTHPDIYVAFTPDEEIGRGMDKFDLGIFKPEFAYTIDGGMVGELEYESFNAARANINIKGESVHPGYAKGIMVNAALLAAEFIHGLPKKQSPAETEGYEGYFHVNSVSAAVESAKITVLIRDFDKAEFENRKNAIKNMVAKLNESYGNRVTLEIKDEYFNMDEAIKESIEVFEIAKRAFGNAGIEPVIKPIRGGTDGSRLSFMGIPCPNIFAGGHNFHGPYEYIPVQSMEKAVSVILEIIKLCSNNKNLLKS